MHIVEKIASELRCKPQKPELTMAYYPVVDKYITIYNDPQTQSMHYDYFDDVMNSLKDVLAENGYTIYQMSTSDKDNRILWTNIIKGATIHQMNFIIKNSSLHICTDAFTNEIAGIFDTPSINLVGNRYAENFYPYWGKKTSMLQGLSYAKPSFSDAEEKKAINKIYPEVVANEISDKLGLGVKQTEKTVFIGEDYPKIEVDFVPSSPLLDPNISKFDIIVRLDKHFCLDSLVASNIQTQVSFWTDKNIRTDFLVGSRAAIKDITFFVDENSEEDMGDNAIQRGINCRFILKKGADPSKTRFRFLGKRVEHNTLDKDEDFSGGDYFKTSKVIIKDGKKYPSYAHLENRIELREENCIIKSALMCETSRFVRVIEKG